LLGRLGADAFGIPDGVRQASIGFGIETHSPQDASARLDDFARRWRPLREARQCGGEAELDVGLPAGIRRSRDCEQAWIPPG
jgi:hypothetical protein